MLPLLPETHLCLSSVEPNSSKDHFPLFFSAGEESLPPAHPATGLGWAYPEAGEPSTKGTVHSIPVWLQSACPR